MTATVLGDPYRLQTYGVPVETIDRINAYYYARAMLAHRSGYDRAGYDRQVQRLHRFNRLTAEQQRVARYFL